MIIYPPYIDGVLPAFINDITIPYAMNPGVSPQEVTGFYLKLTDYYSGDIETLSSHSYDSNTIWFHGIGDLDFDEPYRYFKAQLAYEEEGPYSSVGIIKQIQEPIVRLTVNGNIIAFNYFTELYKTETMKDCSIQIKKDNEIIYTNTQVYQYNQSSYVWYYWFEPNVDYKIAVTYTTTNLYSDTLYEAVRYSGPSIDDIDSIDGIEATANYETGSIDLTINLTNIPLKIYRSIAGKNLWELLAHIDALASPGIYKDFFVEQGERYSYRVVSLFNDEPTPLLGQINVTAEFEDIFLNDATRSLKIRYNPKVSSFKTTVLEQKVDTLGGKYPFFFRNGNTNYKEFTINGLISYFMDEQECFISKKSLGLIQSNDIREKTSLNNSIRLSNSPTTALTDYNITAERKFKLEVLDWLNNGQPKVFKSPTEGTYIVRLNNVSLSPEDALGRLLHNFQSTAYEIADMNIDEYHRLNLGASSKLIAPAGGKINSINNLTSTKTLNWVKDIEIFNFKGVIKYKEYGSNSEKTITKNSVENIHLNFVFSEITIIPNATTCDLVYIQLEGPMFTYIARKEENIIGSHLFEANANEFISYVSIEAGMNGATNYRVNGGAEMSVSSNNRVTIYYSEANQIKSIEVDDSFGGNESKTTIIYYSKISMGGIS